MITQSSQCDWPSLAMCNHRARGSGFCQYFCIFLQHRFPHSIRDSRILLIYYHGHPLQTTPPRPPIIIFGPNNLQNASCISNASPASDAASSNNSSNTHRQNQLNPRFSPPTTFSSHNSPHQAHSSTAPPPRLLSSPSHLHIPPTPHYIPWVTSAICGMH
jgi:hypothetical protein